jgi:hypothetical protein
VPEGDAASYAHLELEAHTSFNSHFTSVSLRVIMYRAEQHDCKENSLLNCMYLLLTIKNVCCAGVGAHQVSVDQCMFTWQALLV